MYKIVNDSYSYIMSDRIDDVIDFIESEPWDKPVLVGQPYQVHGNLNSNTLKYGMPDEREILVNNKQQLIYHVQSQILSYYKANGKELYLVRLFEVWSDDKIPGFLTNSIKIDNYDIYIPEQEIELDCIHVDDVLEAFSLIVITKPKDWIYNVGTGKTIKLTDIALEYGYKYTIHRDSSLRCPTVFKSKANINKLKKLGFYPKKSLNEWMQRQI